MPARVSRRHKSRSQRGRGQGPGAIVGLALGLVVAAAGFLAYMAIPEEPVEEPSVVEPRPAPIQRNPFEFADAMNDTATSGPAETEFKSVEALGVWRRLSKNAAWALAVDSAAKAYPLLEEYRELQAADTNYDNWDWLEPGQAALALFAKADEYGAQVENEMRESRELGWTFESISEARAEWVRYRRELEREVGTLDDPILPPGSDG